MLSKRKKTHLRIALSAKSSRSISFVKTCTTTFCWFLLFFCLSLNINNFSLSFLSMEAHASATADSDETPAQGDGWKSLVQDTTIGALGQAATNAALPYYNAGKVALSGAASGISSAATSAGNYLSQFQPLFDQARQTVSLVPSNPASPAGLGNIAPKPSVGPMPSLSGPVTTFSPIAATQPDNVNTFPASRYNYTVPTTYKFPDYRMPVFTNANTGTLKPITPVFIEPNKLTALKNGLSNTYTAIKPLKIEFAKITITPIKLYSNQFSPAFNKDLKPVFNPIKNPITLPISQPTMIKPQWIKLDNPLNQVIKPVLPKIVPISTLKQLMPLKPIFNPITAIKPLPSTFDYKLTQAPAPVLAPMPKFEFPRYNTLNNPNFAIKPLEPIKMVSLDKINPYLITETNIITPIKPRFEPIAQITPILKPQWINLAEANPVLKPAFIKLNQVEPIKVALEQLNPALNKDLKPYFIPMHNQPIAITQPVLIKPEFTKLNPMAPIFAQAVSIKPQWINIETVKPLNASIDGAITKMPNLAIQTPKFIPADFSAVKQPGFIKISQVEPIKVALEQLNPAFNKDLKPSFIPINNQLIAITQPVAIKSEFTRIRSITPALIQPISIKPQWVELPQLKQLLKPEFTASEVPAPALVEPAPVRPDFERISMPEQIPLRLQPIKPEVVAVKELPVPKPAINKVAALEKIQSPQANSLEFQQPIISAPVKPAPLTLKPDLIQLNTVEKIKTPVVPLFAQANLPAVSPKALENPVSETAKMLINEAEIKTPPAVNLNTFEVAKHNLAPKPQLENLKPKSISLVDNYMQQLKTVYEWQKMHKELAYLSRNAEVIAEKGVPVELAGLNEKIVITKEELDKKTPEVKTILANNLVDPAILGDKNVPVNNLVAKEKPSNELPENLPLDRNLPLNTPALVPQALPKPENGFLQGLRTMFQDNVFARSDNRYAEVIDSDLANIARLRNPNIEHSAGVK